jgi:hypothetical protein
MFAIIIAVVFLSGMFVALALCAAAGRADRQSTALYDERKRAGLDADGVGYAPGLYMDSGEFVPASELNKDPRNV